jgi:hypothetical protein
VTGWNDEMTKVRCHVHGSRAQECQLCHPEQDISPCARYNNGQEPLFPTARHPQDSRTSYTITLSTTHHSLKHSFTALRTNLVHTVFGLLCCAAMALSLLAYVTVHSNSSSSSTATVSLAMGHFFPESTTPADVAVILEKDTS